MEKIKRIRPALPVIPTTPPCSALVTGNYYNKRKNSACANSSSFVIDGKPYCTTHAAQLALKIFLLADGEK